MSRLSLATKFGILSFVVIAAVGIIIGVVLTNQIKAQLFNDYIARAFAIQRAVVSHHVSKSDFKEGSARLSRPGFNNFVTGSVISKDLVFMRIIDSDGKILYSNNREVIGKKLPIRTGLKMALNGQVDAEVETLTERPGSELFLELYSPIKFSGRVVGAFEAYYSLVPLYQRQRTILLYTALLLAGGLGFLWLSLFGLVISASNTIGRQNRRLLRLTDSLSTSLDDLQKNYLGTMESLAQAVEARDPYTSGHSHRMEDLSAAISRQLNLSAEEHQRMERASELHDIGKIGIPEAILTKPGELNPDEWGIMKKHPLVGAEIVERVPFLRGLAPIIRHHHEYYDGRGYPTGLAKEGIPYEARILAVIDAFDAMTSDRPYRKALAPQQAVAILEEMQGSQFDPRVVQAFLALVRRRPDLLAREEAA